MANKCPKTLGNKGLSGTYAIKKNTSATLLQLAMLKSAKRNSCKWLLRKEISICLNRHQRKRN